MVAENRQAFLNEVSKINGVEDWSLCNDLAGRRTLSFLCHAGVETKVQRTEELMLMNNIKKFLACNL